MSISSIAQDSALRLAPGASAVSHSEVAARKSAEVAIAAVEGGSSKEEATAKGTEAGKGAASSSASGSVNSNILAQLVKYVPTEAITIYVAVLAAMGDVKPPKGKKLYEADFSGPWVVIVIMVLATLAMTLGLGYRAQRNAQPTGKFKVPYFDIGAACLAFGVWALALPSTPLRDIKGYDYSAWNPVIILVGTATISFAAYVFNKNVAWEKFLQDA